jgi:uncharacterized protein involved in type VI secretion and phage assembly
MSMIESDEPLYGKYRGQVVNNIDPMQVGRIQVVVPEVSEETLPWAMPCLPWAGNQTGLFAVPPVGSSVWVEFERGDPDHPIWVGGFWGASAEVPPLVLAIPPTVSGLTVQTPTGTGLVLSDMPGPSGGIMLKSRTGATIVVNDTGIVIQNGMGASIVMAGPSVDINAGAMTIT